MASRNGGGLVPAATDNEARKIVDSGKRDKRSSKPSPDETQAAIYSGLSRSDVASGPSPTARGAARVPALRRWPIMGFDSARPLEAWRTDNLGTRIRSVEGNMRLQEGQND